MENSFTRNSQWQLESINDNIKKNQDGKFLLLFVARSLSLPRLKQTLFFMYMDSLLLSLYKYVLISRYA